MTLGAQSQYTSHQPEPSHLSRRAVLFIGSYPPTYRLLLYTVRAYTSIWPSRPKPTVFHSDPVQRARPPAKTAPANSKRPPAMISPLYTVRARTSPSRPEPSGCQVVPLSTAM